MKNQKSKIKNQKSGFTLIEALVVLAVFVFILLFLWAFGSQLIQKIAWER
jgi:prepilin-type N-terminal cleavage/methylation domain-containing protein